MTQLSAVETDLNTATDKATAWFKASISNVLEMYWNVGQLVADLETKHGQATIKTFATKLADKLGKASISESTLYRAKQFHTKYNAEQRKQLVDANITWSELTKVLPENPMIVTEVAAQVVAGDVSPKKLAEAVKQAKEADGVGGSKTADSVELDSNTSDTEDKADKLGDPKELAKLLTSSDNACVKFCDTLADLYIGLSNINNMSEEDRKPYKKTLSSLLESFNNVAETGGTIRKILEELV